jgi:hypothetical protein
MAVIRFTRRECIGGIASGRKINPSHSDHQPHLINPAERAVMSRSPIAPALDALRHALDNVLILTKRATTAPVPAIGALHDGHVSPPRRAQRQAAKVNVPV